MTRWWEPVRDAEDVAALERSTTFDDLVEERSVHDVFAFAAVRQPAAIALTMLMTGTVEDPVDQDHVVGLAARDQVG